jgi:hypothetical protein
LAPRVVRLSPPTRELWARWFDDHLQECQSDGLPTYLRGAWAKMPAQLLRLALVLHACLACATPAAPAAPAARAAELVPDLMGEQTLAAAADLIDYFKAHARRAYRRIRRERRNVALRVLQALRTHGEMNQRALLHDVLKRNVSADELREALEELEEVGLVARREQPSAETGGRPATLWRAT